MFIAGVPIGVLPGVKTGVLPPIWLAGVSSQRDFLLLAPGVGVSPIESPPRSVRGVSAHPLPCPGVSKKQKPSFSVVCKIDLTSKLLHNSHILKLQKKKKDL